MNRRSRQKVNDKAQEERAGTKTRMCGTNWQTPIYSVKSALHGQSHIPHSLKIGPTDSKLSI